MGRELVHIGLAKDDGARFAQAGDDGGIRSGRKSGGEYGARDGAGHAGHVDIVLDEQRDAVQGAAILAGTQLFFPLFRLSLDVRGQRDDGIEPVVEVGDAAATPPQQIGDGQAALPQLFGHGGDGGRMAGRHAFFSSDSAAVASTLRRAVSCPHIQSATMAMPKATAMKVKTACIPPRSRKKAR